MARADVQVPVEQCKYFGYENTSLALPSSRGYSLARRTNLFVSEIQKHLTRPLQDSPSTVDHEASCRGSNVDNKLHVQYVARPHTLTGQLKRLRVGQSLDLRCVYRFQACERIRDHHCFPNKAETHHGDASGDANYFTFRTFQTTH